MRRLTQILARLIGIVAITTTALAGDLNPPAGPVVATGRFGPRTEINAANTPGDADSLFKITQPGSYYLGGNITGVTGKSGIEVDSDSVSIDLMGFALEGVPGAAAGVIVNNLKYSIRVHNGTIRGWPNHGIDGTWAYQSTFDNLRLRANSVAGIRTAYDCNILDVIASDCTLGFYAGQNNLLTRCIAQTCSMGGVVAEPRVTIRNCAFALNGSVSGAEIELVGSGTVSDCTITSSRRCIDGGENVVVHSCALQSGVNEAIVLGGFAVVQGCTVYFSAMDSISVGPGSLVIDNAVRQSRANGIVASDGCLIRGNIVQLAGWSTNDGAAILVTGSRNRIDDNHVSSSDRGIDVDAIDNLITRNSATTNTVNYTIVAGNAHGPIVSVSGIGDIAETVNADHPWANFAY